MDTPSARKHLTHVSICAGAGGIDLGIDRACTRMGINLRTILYVEREAYPAAVLVSRMEEGKMDKAPILPDVHGLPAVAAMYRGKVDIASAGFPCQPFSFAGLRKSESDPRHLWPVIFGWFRTVKPGIVFLENVKGIITAPTEIHKEPVLLRVLRDLEKAGYTAEWGIYTAEEAGAPHERARVFIMAYRNSLRRGQGRHLSRKWKPESVDGFVPPPWPAPKGAEQYDYEPQRILTGRELADTDSGQDHPARSREAKPAKAKKRKKPGQQVASGTPRRDRRRSKSALGGNADGVSTGTHGDKKSYPPNWSREMRCLGNAVVPAVAEIAFVELWQILGLQID